MDRQYIDDQHVIARYLADQLSESDREAFEAYYLEHPEVVQEMETVARFKAGLMQLDRTGELERLIKAQPQFSRWHAFAAAAAIGAIAVGTALYVSRQPPPPSILASTITMLGADVVDIVDSQQIIRMRGEARADAEIELTSPAGAIELEILPEYEDPAARYRVSLARVAPASEQHVAEIDGIGMNDRGFVTVYLNSARLQPGQYALRLAGESAKGTEETSVFSVRVTQP